VARFSPNTRCGRFCHRSRVPSRMGLCWHLAALLCGSGWLPLLFPRCGAASIGPLANRPPCAWRARCRCCLLLFRQPAGQRARPRAGPITLPRCWLAHIAGHTAPHCSSAKRLRPLRALGAGAARTAPVMAFACARLEGDRPRSGRGVGWLPAGPRLASVWWWGLGRPACWRATPGRGPGLGHCRGRSAQGQRSETQRCGDLSAGKAGRLWH